MGDKITAKETMIAAGVPVIPGSGGLIADYEEAKIVAAQVGYPIMVKATAGGGGKGMRLVWTEEELESKLASAQQEAKAEVVAAATAGLTD
jgi:acetyl-CoA carboxylase biotin carboxylase subunit